MQFERGSRWWGLAASAAIHALLWGVLMLALRHPVPPQQRGAVLQVRLLAPPPPPAPAPAPVAAAAQAAAIEPAAPAIAVAVAPVREDIRYYDPEELERQLILLRDRAADDGVAVPRAVVMQLLVDLTGRVVLIRFEGAALPPELELRLRAAFMTLEFLPALRHGRAVPARIRIELLPDAPG